MTDDLREARRLLAGATVRRDAVAQRDPAVREAARRWPQLGGELLLRLPQGSRDADLVAEVAALLAERDWDGDQVLVRQLRGDLIHPDAVELDEVVWALDSAEGGWLDPRTGELTLAEVADDVGLDTDDEEFVFVPGEGSAAGWQDRRSFVETLPHGGTREALERALDGRGAFRRFAGELDRHEELIAAFLGWRTTAWRGALASGSPTPACSTAPDLAHLPSPTATRRPAAPRSRSRLRSRSHNVATSVHTRALMQCAAEAASRAALTRRSRAPQLWRDYRAAAYRA